MSASFTDLYASAVYKISNGVALTPIEANVLAAVSAQLTIASASIPPPASPTEVELEIAEIEEWIYQEAVDTNVSSS